MSFWCRLGVHKWRGIAHEWSCYAWLERCKRCGKERSGHSFS